MQNVETKTGEELLLGAAQSMRFMAEELATNTEETQEPRELTAAEKKVYRKSLAEVVKAFTQEYEYYGPPYRKMLYWFLFARAAKKHPPKETMEKLKITNRESFEYCVGKFDALLGDAPAIVQEIVLAKLLKALEPEEAEYEKEIARNEAFDKVLDALSEWTTKELLYLAEQIKNGALGLAIKRVASKIDSLF